MQFACVLLCLQFERFAFFVPGGKVAGSQSVLFVNGDRNQTTPFIMSFITTAPTGNRECLSCTSTVITICIYYTD